MANVEINDLTNKPTPLSTDELELQATAGGASAKGTIQNVLNAGAGRETIWIPSGAMRPTVSNGCAAIQDVETTAGNPDMTVLDFDSTADEHAQFQVDFPKAWNNGTVTYRFQWTIASTSTDGVAVALQGVAVANDGSIDTSYGTPIVVTDAASGTAEDLMVSAESAEITISGTPTDDKLCFFRLFRDVSDAGDDLAEDMRLLGIQFYYTVDTTNDE